jgi:hypothetical protein
LAERRPLTLLDRPRSNFLLGKIVSEPPHNCTDVTYFGEPRLLIKSSSDSDSDVVIAPKVLGVSLQYRERCKNGTNNWKEGLRSCVVCEHSTRAGFGLQADFLENHDGKTDERAF